MTGTRTVPQSLWKKTPFNVFRVDLTEARAAELDALLKNSTPFRDICRINYGAQISSTAGVHEAGHFGKDEYLADSSSGLDNPKKYYDGDAMRPYGMHWPGTWLDYRPDLFYGPRKPALFENPKVSVRYVSGDADTFLAWVDQEGYYTDHLVIHATPYHSIRSEPSYRVTDVDAERSRLYPLFYLLGIIMSRPVLRYYADLYATGSLQGAFSHVYPDTVKTLPIPTLMQAPPEPPEDWRESAKALSGGRRVTRAAIRRTFRNRHTVAGVLTAAARSRQQVEAARRSRAENFAALMDSRSPGWRWPSGHSLESPADEATVLRSLGEKSVSIATVTAVRDAYQRETSAAMADVSEAELLQRILDALSDFLFSERPTRARPS